MTEETKTPAPGSFAHLMSPTPPEKDKEPVKRVRKVHKQTDNPGSPNVHTGSTNARAYVLAQIPPAPERRQPERYAFQFWADQITRLKKLRQALNLTRDPEDRKEVALSDMVRQAVDDYLSKQIRQISKGVRSTE
jgi:hypothetical protein